MIRGLKKEPAQGTKQYSGYRVPETGIQTDGKPSIAPDTTPEGTSPGVVVTASVARTIPESSAMRLRRRY